MATHVISDSGRSRKRGGALGSAVRRIGALVVTLAAIAALGWIAPRLHHAPLTAPAALPSAPAAPDMSAAAPDIGEVLIVPAPPQPAVRHRRAIPLNVPHHALPGDDLDILSAAELDEISQAHAGDPAALAAPVEPATRAPTVEDRVRDDNDG